MKVLETPLNGVLVVEPDIFGDKRGFFLETYNYKRYGEAGIGTNFVQDNLSYSVRGTLRGLHYQHPHAQAKLVQVIAGEVYDVSVDIRGSSPSFGKWTGVYLSEENRRQVYVPEGFAHGFCVLSETAIILYKCSDFYAPDSEGGILWCDPDLGVEWPVEDPLVSDKDRRFSFLRDVPRERLPINRKDT